MRQDAEAAGGTPGGPTAAAPALPADAAAPAGTPSLTVAILVEERPEALRRCLDALRGQGQGFALRGQGPGFGILVVDATAAPAAAERVAMLVAALPNGRLLRAARPGRCAALDAALRAAGTTHLACLGEDTIPAPDWAGQVFAALATTPAPALLGGRILPQWEERLPPWWPQHLRGVLGLQEYNGAGEYRSARLPRGVQPVALNLVVHRASAMAVGGFVEGPAGLPPLDEEVLLARRLQEAGFSARHAPQLLVHHAVPPARQVPAWLLERLFWHGAHAVATRRNLGQAGWVWPAAVRRLLVLLLCGPALLLPPGSARLMPLRWRAAYARGFLRQAFARRRRSLLRPAGRPPMPAMAAARNELWVVYDGHCPFCSRWVQLYRLRQSVGPVHLVDARGGQPALAEVAARGLDLDEGMAVKWQGQWYHGDQAMGVLAMLGSGSGLFTRANRWLFGRPRLAQAVYPWLVRGRALALWALRRQRIGAAQSRTASA